MTPGEIDFHWCNSVFLTFVLFEAFTSLNYTWDRINGFVEMFFQINVTCDND